MNEVYSARIVQPNIAYLKQNAFGDEFMENDLMNEMMYTSLNEIIYVGPFGTTEAISNTFVCQTELCV